MTPDELPAWLREHADRVRPAVLAAADGMAKAFQRGVVNVELRRYTHPPYTRTTSPPGEPPALVTGTLRRSVRAEPAIATGDWSARSSVAPHTVYARIQELGGHIRPVRAAALRWTEDGQVVFSMHSYLPKRPYMAPARERMVADGSLRRAAQGEFGRVMGWDRG